MNLRTNNNTTNMKIQDLFSTLESFTSITVLSYKKVNYNTYRWEIGVELYDDFIKYVNSICVNTVTKDSIINIKGADIELGTTTVNARNAVVWQTNPNQYTRKKIYEL